MTLPNSLTDRDHQAFEAIGATPARRVVMVNPLDSSTDSVSGESRLPTYSAASVNVTPYSSAQDLFEFGGSTTAGVILMPRRIEFSLTAAAAGLTDVRLIKRSSSNGGGTSAALVKVPHDSNDSASGAQVKVYTAAHTSTGTAVGVVRAAKHSYPSTTGDPGYRPLVWTFGDLNDKGVWLRNSSEALCLNLNGAVISSGAANFDITWAEKTT